jgi:hypothetical protein
MWKYHKKTACVAISKKQKCYIFFFVFLFSSTKSENRRAEQVLQGRRVGTNRRRKGRRKGVRG